MDKRLGFVVGALWGLCALATAAEVQHPSVRRAAEAARLTADTADYAAICQTLAVQAVENALAIQREADERLVAALRRGTAADIAEAYRARDAAAEEAGEALRQGRQVIQDVGVVVDCAASAAGEAARAQDSADRKVRERSARDAERQYIEAEKAADRARVVVEELKRKWLLPVPSNGGREPGA